MDTTIGSRIIALRKALNLTQQTFADRISCSRAAVGKYETGVSVPLNPIISAICREFGVDEIWLRTGEGEMFRPRTRGEQIAAFAGELMRDSPDSFRAAFVSVLAELSLEAWKILERLATEALSRTASPNPPSTQNQED